MLELFLPLVIAFALGIEPEGGGGGAAAAPAPAEAQEALPDSPPDTARAPEPQVATGRFTTALEVKPILAATKGNWVVVREWDGQDWVYFTHLLSWRCGLWEIRFGINGAPPSEVFPMEECHEDTMQPNAMVTDLPIYRTYPAGSVTGIAVEITFDDGTTDSHAVTRQQVLLP